MTVGGEGLSRYNVRLIKWSLAGISVLFSLYLVSFFVIHKFTPELMAGSDSLIRLYRPLVYWQAKGDFRFKPGARFEGQFYALNTDHGLFLFLKTDVEGVRNVASDNVIQIAVEHVRAINLFSRCRSIVIFKTSSVSDPGFYVANIISY